MYKKLKERITETTQYYLLRNVHPRAEQPFQVRDDEEMEQLVESIHMNGVLNPLIVTPRRGGGYEIVSGHRRYAACQKLGVDTIPVIVRDLEPDEATLCMIDSNLHREHLLPSEKAYAYKAKMEVLNRQGQRYGQTSSQPATKWDAAISLVVGGIGIMNIMLVSVTERTKEIGIRKAVGARRKHIMFQFLCEACVLSVLGGLIGLGLSFAGIQIYNLVSGASAVMNWGVGGAAIAFCAVIGIVFGGYPAAKASRLQPIDALHYS